MSKLYPNIYLFYNNNEKTLLSFKDFMLLYDGLADCHKPLLTSEVHLDKFILAKQFSQLNKTMQSDNYWRQSVWMLDENFVNTVALSAEKFFSGDAYARGPYWVNLSPP